MLTDGTNTQDMAPKSNILENVISAQQEAEIDDFDPSRIISTLLRDLPLRARKIVIERYGLEGKPVKTLEELGAIYGITRERVRQIESTTVRSLASDAKKLMAPVVKLLRTIFYENGDVVEENTLLEQLLEEERRTEANRNILVFLLEILPDFQRNAETKNFKANWSVSGFDLEKPQQLIDIAAKLFEGKNTAMSTDDLMAALRQDQVVQAMFAPLENSMLLSYLSLSKKIRRTPFGEWGLAAWRQILPRGVRDKAFLVIKKHGKPLHFTKITEMINKAGFDRRVAHPQTVHNELIKDERFVLVGRGIYALKEWGYQEGTVADILVRILKKENRPLTREELIERVLDERLVKRNTIIIGLQDKTKFTRVEGKKYILAAVAPQN